MGWGALGRAVARGVGEAANMGAGLAAKEFDRQQDTGQRMTLEEHASRLRGELQARQNEWAAGQADAEREFKASEARMEREHRATMSASEREAADRRQAAADEAALKRVGITEGGANARAAMANTIAQQQVDISRDTARYNQSIPPEVKMALEGLQKQIEIETRALDAIKPTDDPDGTKAKPIMDRILQMQREQQALFQNVRQQGPLNEAQVRGRGNPRSIGYDPNRP